MATTLGGAGLAAQHQGATAKESCHPTLLLAPLLPSTPHFIIPSPSLSVQSH